jgi:hypothetical protein
MNFPATDIEYSMQDEIDRLKARIGELEQQLGECSGGFDTSTKMIASLEAERDRLREALLWCSGSPDFGPGGQARVGWEKMCQPLLQNRAALDGGKP